MHFYIYRTLEYIPSLTCNIIIRFSVQADTCALKHHEFGEMRRSVPESSTLIDQSCSTFEAV